jgi:hypothetical protein
LQDEALLEQYYYYNLLSQLSAPVSQNPYQYMHQFQLYISASWSAYIDESLYAVLLRSSLLWIASIVFHIKTPPQGNEADAMNWSVSSFLSLFSYHASQSKIDPELITQATNAIALRGIDDFDFLTQSGLWCATYFPPSHGTTFIEKFLQPWHEAIEKNIWKLFYGRYESQTYIPTFEYFEYQVITALSPQESLHETVFRFLGTKGMSFFVGLLPLKEIRASIKELRQQQITIVSIFDLLAQKDWFQERFIAAFRMMVVKTRDTKYNHTLSQELSDFFDDVEDGELVSIASLPELLRKESQHMHVAMQYYMQYMLDLQAATPTYHQQSESGILVEQWFTALYQPLGSGYSDETTLRESIQSQYEANLAYHAFAYKYILAKAEKFSIPYFIQKAHFSNFEQSKIFKTALGSLLSPLFQRNNVLIASRQERKLFKEYFKSTIQTLLKEEDKDIL